MVVFFQVTFYVLPSKFFQVYKKNNINNKTCILRVLSGLEPQKHTSYLRNRAALWSWCSERGDLVPLDIQSIPGVSFKMEP